MLRKVASFLLRALTGIGSLLLSMHGLYAYSGLNLRLDSVPASLYCFLPLLSFPAWLLGVWRLRSSVVTQWAFAVVYLAAYSFLNWRTCSELGYCQGVSATLWLTLTTRYAEAMFAVALLNTIATRIRD
jgi:hypothetical protein